MKTSGIGRVILHPHPVAEQRAAAERRRRVDRQHADPLARARGRPATSAEVVVDLPTPGRTGEADDLGVPGTAARAAQRPRAASGEASSTSEISRATAAGSPPAPRCDQLGDATRPAGRRRRSGSRRVIGRRHAQDQRVALAAAAAQPGGADAAAAPLQLEREVQHDPGTRHADRVTERDRAAVDVDLVLADAELAHRLRCRPRRTPR